MLPPEAIYVPGHARLARQGGGYTVAAGLARAAGRSDRALTFRIPADAPAGRYNLGMTVTGTVAMSAPVTATAISWARPGAVQTAMAALPVVSRRRGARLRRPPRWATATSSSASSRRRRVP